jgi:hypothetical protein
VRNSSITPVRAESSGGISLPVAVFLCGLAMLALAAFIAWRFRPASAPHAPPAASNPDQPIAALSAEFTTDSGATISARLAPLHADASRQSFESVSMRERLALPEGQPWRLSLRYDAKSAADGAAPAPLALGAVEVSDEKGLALSSIPGAAAGAAPADPLRALVVAPSGTLQPGQAVDWVLWGRAPLAPARLNGLAGVELAFQAHSIRRSELSLPLARLDRDAVSAGKNDDSAASDGEHGDGDHENAPADHH